MRYVRLLLLLTLAMGFVQTVSARAQNSPYSRPEDNVGSWSWDKPQTRNSEEDHERKLGETSWERLHPEQEPEASPPPRQELLKSLSPLGLWRWWRGEKKPDATDETASTEAEEPASEEPPTEDE